MCRIPALACALLIGLGCGGRTPRQLVEIYRPQATLLRATASSVIFVPGVMGSALRDPEDGRVVWGHVWNDDAEEKERLRDLALPYDPQTSIPGADDNLVPAGELLFLEVDLGMTAARARVYPGVFEGIVQALTDAGAHDREPEAIGRSEVEEGRNPIIGFGYDWRRDITSEARRLHEVVLAASRAREAATGDARVDIVAHSMGTQLVRYYLRYGPEPLPREGPLPEITWAGARRVRRAFLIAPPNRGEARALEVLVEGLTLAPVVAEYPAALSASFPSSYEMLPHHGDARVVYDDGEEVDVFDVGVWERYGWGPLAEDQDDMLRTLLPEERSRETRLGRVTRHIERNLRHAQRLRRALDRPTRPPSTLGLHIAAGDTTETNAVLEVARADGSLSWRAREPGDGMVTRTSALGQPPRTPAEAPTVFPHSVHFVSEKHLGMTGDPDLINHILYWLLQAPSPLVESVAPSLDSSAPADAQPSAAAPSATSGI